MTHHKLDIKPVPKQVLYVNEPELIDRSLFNLRPDKPEEQADNIRIYIPLDLNREAIIRRLEDIIEIFEEVNYNNEGNFCVTVGMLIQQIEIYDQIWTVRNLSDSNKHSKKTAELVKEFITVLESIPDKCAEYFPYDVIEDLRREYLTDEE